MGISVQEIQCFNKLRGPSWRGSESSKGIRRYTPCCPQFEGEAKMDIDLLLSYFTSSFNILLQILITAPYNNNNNNNNNNNFI